MGDDEQLDPTRFHFADSKCGRYLASLPVWQLPERHEAAAERLAELAEEDPLFAASYLDAAGCFRADAERVRAARLAARDR